jgi:hypothetical protein
MEEMLCAMALKSANGRQTYHTNYGLPVCCEQALKSAGTQNTHGGVPLQGPSGNRPRERSNTSGWRGEALHGIDGGDLAAWPFVLRRQITDRKYRLALRAAATKSASRSLRRGGGAGGAGGGAHVRACVRACVRARAV